MTAFNKGDRIVFVKDDYYFGVEMPKGTRATYDDDEPAESAPWVRLDTGERVLASRDRIAHAEPETVPPFEATTNPDGSITARSNLRFVPDAPQQVEDGLFASANRGLAAALRIGPLTAPLDPSKVKPGDTVTLESDDLEASVQGRVTDIQHDHGAWTIYLTLGVMGHSTPFVVGVGTVYTLTAHQPAPEPEPEWDEGVIYLATNIHNGYRGPVLYDAMRGEGGSGLFTFILSEDEYDPTDLRDVRPAVVIDPADVDRLAAIIREVDGNHDLGAAALAEAILERLAR